MRFGALIMLAACTGFKPGTWDGDGDNDGYCDLAEQEIVDDFSWNCQHNILAGCVHAPCATNLAVVYHVDGCPIGIAGKCGECADSAYSNFPNCTSGPCRSCAFFHWN